MVKTHSWAFNTSVIGTDINLLCSGISTRIHTNISVQRYDLYCLMSSTSQGKYFTCSNARHFWAMEQCSVEETKGDGSREAPDTQLVTLALACNIILTKLTLYRPDLNDKEGWESSVIHTPLSYAGKNCKPSVIDILMTSHIIQYLCTEYLRRTVFYSIQPPSLRRSP